MASSPKCLEDGKVCSRYDHFPLVKSLLTFSGIFDREPPRDLGPLAPYEVPKGANVVEGQFFVMLKASASLKAHTDWIGIRLNRPKNEYRPMRSINGYSAHLSEELVQDLIRCDPHVDRVDPNVYIQQEIHDRPFIRNMRLQTRRWKTEYTSLMRWWNKMITAGKRVSDWDLQPGVFYFKVADSHSH